MCKNKYKKILHRRGGEGVLELSTFNTKTSFKSNKNKVQQPFRELSVWVIVGVDVTQDINYLLLTPDFHRKSIFYERLSFFIFWGGFFCFCLFVYYFKCLGKGKNQLIFIYLAPVCTNCSLKVFIVKDEDYDREKPDTHTSPWGETLLWDRKRPLANPDSGRASHLYCE